jgi:hypothetical protein
MDDGQASAEDRSESPLSSGETNSTTTEEMLGQANSDEAAPAVLAMRDFTISDQQGQVDPNQFNEEEEVEISRPLQTQSDEITKKKKLNAMRWYAIRHFHFANKKTHKTNQRDHTGSVGGRRTGQTTI